MHSADGRPPLQPPAGGAAPAQNPAPSPAPAAPWAPPAAAASYQPQDPAARAGSDVSGEHNVSLNQLLLETVALGSSDMHVVANAPTRVRVDGTLHDLLIDGKRLIFSPQQTRRILFEALSEEQQQRVEEDLDLDMAYQLDDQSRFRVNLFHSDGHLEAVFRLIPVRIRTLDELGLPSSIHALAGKANGLVLVTGPTGSGKSTTLAALIDEVNRNRHEHILTIEDPVEYVHKSKNCVVRQREIGRDVPDFAQALRSALRQDPDIILVGEMRDPETIGLAITLAETGHLVFATLHTQDASQAVDRIVDSFPAEQQNQIRAQLAMTLQAIVTQQLVPATGGGRLPALEIMLADLAVRHNIRDGKAEQLYSLMQTGNRNGMQTMEQSLAALVQSGRVSSAEAVKRAPRQDELAHEMGRAASAS
jgi:twitching motility protein PilT